MTKSEAGSRGGVAPLHNQGKHKCPVCGHESDTGYYQAQGSKGGSTTLERYGREHMQAIGKRGGRARNKKEDINGNGSAINSADTQEVPDVLP